MVPKTKLLFSSPRAIFWNWPKIVEDGDFPGIPESYNKEPEPLVLPKDILNWTSASI